ncbi:MAG: N-acetylglucosamine-6-phosphate deacetylase [Planctomycetota bacterium]|nr:MAG: N-acetylglucosamine-6-phosphate deacetylase [Planctomycetota bacterium]
MTKRLLVMNCRLFDAEYQEKVSILIEDGVIRQIGDVESEGGCNVLDAEGRIAAPGFIDVHIQGAGGADVLDGTIDGLEAISRTCARFGVTSFLATTVYNASGDNEHLALAADCTGRDLGGANLIGIHLEGPFIAETKKGMIQPDCICHASMDVLYKILDITAGKLTMMTIAPELDGSLEIIHRLVDSHIVASFAHSGADYEQTLAGITAGISHATHLFNAMTRIPHRAPGPLVAIFENEKVTAQLIADGVHLHPSVLKLAFDILGPERIVLITDGMQAMGLPDGQYVYNGVEYESKNGAARYKDGTLIGTALGLSELVKRLISFTDCNLELAVKMVAENPAKVLGLTDRKGSIAVGIDADLFLLDEDLSVQATIVGGKVVFHK